MAKRVKKPNINKMRKPGSFLLHLDFESCDSIARLRETIQSQSHADKGAEI
jgi:hypothetical protein